MYSLKPILLLISAVTLLSGCLVLPIPTAERKVLAGQQVTPEQLASFTPKVTTKAEVTGQLGSPTMIWEDARLYVYEWAMRCGVLLWAVGGDAGAGSVLTGSQDLQKRYILLIQFDEQGRVRRFEKAVWRPPKSNGDFLREWVGKSDTMAGEDLNERKE